MDHLNIPEGCRPQARDVPYLGLAPKYDKLGFDGFPERHNLKSDVLISSHSILQWRAEWIESFIQEWLWFGLMHEFAKACEVRLDLNDFIINSLSDSGQIVTTTSLYNVYARRVAIRQLELYPSWMQGRLPSLKPLIAWTMAKLGIINANNTTDQNVSGDKASLGILWERLIICRNCANNFTWRQNRPGPTAGRIEFAKCVARVQRAIRIIMAQQNPILRFEIVVSIDILCHTLVDIIGVFLDEHIEVDAPSQDVTDNFQTAMIARNWCPSRIFLEYAENTSLAYMISLLPSYETVSHRGCRQSKCLIRPSNVEAMTGLHRKYCEGGCLSVRIDELQLFDMWKRGGIPGLRQVKDGEPTEFEILDCMTEPFVAISHVWSHGLGNHSKNELPSCQVGFLLDLVMQVAGKEAILWIDTLSVPAERERKRIAIAKLRTVYAKARKVLVIDKDLMRVGSDENEQILQLLSSEWQRRLWTLQEGRLAHDLHIQFKDGAVSVSKLIAATPLSRIREFNAEIFNNIFMMMNMKMDIQNRFSEKENFHALFLALVEDLARRSVTVESDEPICLATLLRLQLEDFNADPTMLDIYRSVQSIPQDLMFRRQPRLQAPGLTWAPSTFLGATFFTFPSEKDSHPGRLSVDGLHVVKDCLLFSKDLNFRRNSSSAPEVYIVESSDGQTFALQSVDYVSEHGASTRFEPSRLISKPAVIWMKTTSTGQFKTTSAAVLVSRLHEKDDITYCQFEMDLNGWRVGEAYEDSHKRYLASSGGIIENVLADFVAEKSLCVG
jgi:hypothetical protein